MIRTKRTSNRHFLAQVSAVAAALAVGCLVAPAAGAVETTADRPASVSDLSAAGLSRVSGPAVLSGRFTNAAGRGVGALTVTLRAIDVAAPVGRSVTVPVVGTTRTHSDGSWTFVVPTSLAASVRKAADLNGGVLNLSATVNGYTVAGDRVMRGVSFLSAGVASGRRTTVASATARANAKPSVAVMGLDVDHTGRGALARKSPTMIPQQDLADVIGGVDYRTAQPLDNPCTVRTKTLKTATRYTVVGESHAYYDAYASFIYNSTMSTSIGAAFSLNGSDWSLSGTVSQNGSTGHSVGYSHRGPYFADQYKVPVLYRETEETDWCLHGGTTYSYGIAPAGYHVPAGGAVGEYGQSVRSHDGAAGYYASNPKYRGYIQKQSFYTVEKGSGLTYGAALTVWGVSLSAQTSYNTSHTERIDTGSGALEHDIWGSKGTLSGKPGVVYSF